MGKRQIFTKNEAGIGQLTRDVRELHHDLKTVDNLASTDLFFFICIFPNCWLDRWLDSNRWPLMLDVTTHKLCSYIVNDEAVVVAQLVERSLANCRGPLFESGQWQKLLMNIYWHLYWQDEKKRPVLAQINKRLSMQNLHPSHLWLRLFQIAAVVCKNAAICKIATEKILIREINCSYLRPCEWAFTFLQLILVVFTTFEV